MRLMPIDTVCRADLDSVTKVCKQLFPQHFPQDGSQIRVSPACTLLTPESLRDRVLRAGLALHWTQTWICVVDCHAGKLMPLYQQGGLPLSGGLLNPGCRHLQFAIVFEKRASGDILKRDDTLKIVAPLVPQVSCCW